MSHYRYGVAWAPASIGEVNVVGSSRPRIAYCSLFLSATRPHSTHAFSCLYFQAERLADYGRLLGGSQPALNGRRRDLDRIQDLFPHDYLGLHETEPNSTYHAVSVPHLNFKSSSDKQFKWRTTTRTDFINIVFFCGLHGDTQAPSQGLGLYLDPTRVVACSNLFISFFLCAAPSLHKRPE